MNEDRNIFVKKFREEYESLFRELVHHFDLEKSLEDLEDVKKRRIVYEYGDCVSVFMDRSYLTHPSLKYNELLIMVRNCVIRVVELPRDYDPEFPDSELLKYRFYILKDGFYKNHKGQLINTINCDMECLFHPTNTYRDYHMKLISACDKLIDRHRKKLITE